MWHPEPVTAPRALGNSLYRIPGSIRSLAPRTIRESIRQRIGPFAPWERDFPLEAPPAAPGTDPGPPDFVGIGAQKSGTTWWFELLAAHPHVYQPAGHHKERHFFARFAAEEFGPGEVERYHRWFPRLPGTITGEWTPDYLYQPWVPSLLSMAAPEARLLLMVRDPIERFVSGVAHAELRPGSHLGSVLAEAVHRGLYASALRPWLATFPGEQLLVLQYERCVADPAGELARTAAFLGVTGDVAAGDLRAPVSPTTGAKLELAGDARRRLVDIYADDVTELAGRFPDLDLGLWPDFK